MRGIYGGLLLGQGLEMIYDILLEGQVMRSI